MWTLAEKNDTEVIICEMYRKYWKTMCFFIYWVSFLTNLKQEM